MRILSICRKEGEKKKEATSFTKDFYRDSRALLQILRRISKTISLKIYLKSCQIKISYFSSIAYLYVLIFKKYLTLYDKFNMDFSSTKIPGRE